MANAIIRLLQMAAPVIHRQIVTTCVPPGPFSGRSMGGWPGVRGGARCR